VSHRPPADFLCIVVLVRGSAATPSPSLSRTWRFRCPSLRYCGTRCCVHCVNGLHVEQTLLARVRLMMRADQSQRIVHASLAFCSGMAKGAEATCGRFVSRNQKNAARSRGWFGRIQRMQDFLDFDVGRCTEKRRRNPPQISLLWIRGGEETNPEISTKPPAPRGALQSQDAAITAKIGSRQNHGS